MHAVLDIAPTANPVELPAVTRRKLGELFTSEEIARLTARSDLRGAWAIASTWAAIIGIFALLAHFPHPLTFVLALILLAGRQLALAILEHEGSHGTLFRTRWMNEVFCDWLCARPIWQNLHKYRAHHRGHHTLTGTEQDPDISLHRPYPTSGQSMRRKLLRDVSGYTGLKLMLGLLLMDAGVFKWTVAADVERLPQDGRHWWSYVLDFFRNAAGMLLTNALLFALLAASGHAWLYGVWVLAYITPFPLFVRIRSIAEHGCTERSVDMFRNTRSTRAGWLARLTVAPLQVNHHTEHHLMASVPYYRLAEMHRLLRARQALPESPNYLDVLRLASSAA